MKIITIVKGNMIEPSLWNKFSKYNGKNTFENAPEVDVITKSIVACRAYVRFFIRIKSKLH